MKIYSVLPKLLLEILACFMLLYVISYPCLRVTRILVARNYFVSKPIAEGGQLCEHHFNIDHGPAFVYGEMQPYSSLGTLYSPLSFIEAYFRGYGSYPKISINEECPD